MPLEFVAEEWVYMGRRLHGSVVADYFCQVGTSINDPMTFKADRKARLVGGVYKVMVSRDGDKLSARIGSAEFLRQSDLTQVDTWRMEHDATDVVVKLRREEASGKRADLDSLAPLRLAYQRLRTTDERLAFEVSVLKYLRT